MEPRGVVGLYDPAERPLYRLCLEPEHPRHPRQRRPRARRASGRGALCRARCRRRLRRQELHLSRARADAVGGEAGRPAGQVDRHPQRGFLCRPSGARTSAPRRRWRSTPTAGFWRCASPAPPISAPISGSAGGVQTFQYAHLPGTVYRIPAIELRIAAVLTNTAPIGVTARAGLCRGGQHHRAADRRGGAAMRLRPRRIAAPQHGAGRGDADDQRVRQHRSTAAPSPRPSTGRWPRADVAGFAARRRRQRGARAAARARLRLSHQGHRRLAARRMSISASRRTAPCR